MHRPCPGCSVPMQPLFFDQPGGGDVQLDRCAACHGIWFDAHEAQAVSGRPLPFASLDAACERRCPACKVTMTAGLLDDAMPVETCTTCMGLWFDEEDLGLLKSKRLKQLAGRQKQQARPGAARPAGGAGGPDGVPESEASKLAASFECAKCLVRVPRSEVNGTAAGLVCRACTPQMLGAPGNESQLMQASGGVLGLLSTFAGWVLSDDDDFDDW